MAIQASFASPKPIGPSSGAPFLQAHPSDHPYFGGPVKPLGAVSSYPYGYTGSGWRYPLGNQGVTATYSTTPGKPPVYQVPQSVLSGQTNPLKVSLTGATAGPINNPATLSAWFQMQEKGDPQYVAGTQGQLDALKQLWEGGVRTPWQQSLIQYGGQLPDQLASQLQSYGAPTVKDPITGADVSVGQSLGNFDPGTMAAAAANPYSTLNQIQHQLGLWNATTDARLSRMGAQRSGQVGTEFGENTYQAGLQRYNAANAMLQQLGGNFTNFLGNEQQYAQNQSQLLSDAYNRVVQNIQLGYTTPDQYPAGYGGGLTINGASISPTYFQSGKGTYGFKPQY